MSRMHQPHEANSHSKNAENLNECLDILGQQPHLNTLYTPLSLIFSVTEDSSQLRSVILRKLETGLKRLSKSFPWVAGQVVNEDGIFKIKSFEEIPRLNVKDLRNS